MIETRFSTLGEQIVFILVHFLTINEYIFFVYTFDCFYMCIVSLICQCFFIIICVQSFKHSMSILCFIKKNILFFGRK